MNSRDRILTTLKKGIPDRVGNHEHVWGETEKLWHKQGLPEKTSSAQYFDYDIRGIGADLSLQLPAQKIEETDEYIIERNANGVTLKRHKLESGHTPYWIDHTIKTRKDWLELKPRWIAKKDRIPAALKDQYAAHRKDEKFICMTLAEPYEACWPILGQVGIFTAMLDEPDFVSDMFNTYTGMVIEMFDLMVEDGYDFDGVWFWGDVGYRNATLFSPKIYDELLWPCHKRLCDKVKALGKVSILHSCGKIEVLIPRFIEAGFDAIQPLEAKVGQDVRVLKKKFGNAITFFGNMDVRKLSGTRKDVEDEVLDKLKVAMEGGGYIFHSDHSVPPTVSFDNYKYALELVRTHGVYR